MSERVRRVHVCAKVQRYYIRNYKAKYKGITYNVQRYDVGTELQHETEIETVASERVWQASRENEGGKEGQKNSKSRETKGDRHNHQLYGPGPLIWTQVSLIIFTPLIPFPFPCACACACPSLPRSCSCSCSCRLPCSSFRSSGFV